MFSSERRLESTPDREKLGIVLGLAIVAAIELLVLRTFTRTAVHIPALEALAGPYRVISGFGRYAYFVSLALLLLAVPLIIRAGWRRRTGPSLMVASGLAILMAVFALASFGLLQAFFTDVASVTVVAVLALAAIASVPGRARVSLGCFAIAFIAGGSHTALQAGRQDRIIQLDSGWLLNVAELLAIGFAVTSPWLLRRSIPRSAIVVGAIVAVATYGALLGNGSTVRILLLWNEGLSGTMPALAYAAAGGAICMTLVTLVRGGDHLLAAGLVLLVAGGFGLHNTYQTTLVAAGLSVICLAFVADSLGRGRVYARPAGALSV